jgi:hypothetical protein
MCFWFGLETLRLVYKKSIFKILNGFELFDLLSSEKSNTALIRVEKMYSK